MKLYDCATAPSPRRVRIFLAEKGVEIETVQVDLMKGEQFSDTFRQLNPNMDVPVLELDDGTCLSQVDSISRYLEEAYPQNPLWGRDPVERAKVDSWNHLILMNGMLAMAEAFRNSTPGMKNRALIGPHNYEQIPALAERGVARVHNFFADMEKHFAASKYVVGDYFSVADISALVVVDFAKWIKIRIGEDQPNLQRWYDEVSVRPSAKA